MFKIWALVVEDDNEENISLFWRKQDILELFPSVVEDVYGDELEDFDGVMEQIQTYSKAGQVEKMLKYVAKETGIDFELMTVDVEGKIDGAQYQRLGKLVQGPRLVKERPAKTTRRRAAAGCEIPMFVNGERVG